MISSLRKLPARKYLASKRSLPLFLFLITAIILNPFQSVNAQEIDNKPKWSFGLQAGVLSGNLPTVSATNSLVSRFNVENDYYLTAALQAGYAISEYELLQLTLSSGEFSVFTDHEFWPDVIFKNQFYSANLSTQLGLRRFIGSLPNRLDPYGSFGLGLMSSYHTVSPLDSQGTDQNDYSDDISNDLSFLFTTGFGLDYSLNSRISIFFQFKHNFLSTDIINKNLAGDVLQNDFIQTVNNWSTYTSGFRIKFGRSKTRTQTETDGDDFLIVSTITADRLTELEEQFTDPNESIDEEEQVSESGDSAEEEITESNSATTEAQIVRIPPENAVETQNEEEIAQNEILIAEESTELDSTTVEPQLVPVRPEITAEIQNEVEITQNEILTPEVEPDSEVGGLDDNNEDDIVFVTQSKYGLMGTVIEEISGSYTINLHSFSEHNDADRSILLLSVEGFRVVTKIANVNGVDYLRVGVGQFETRGEARSAAESLPEPYRNNYFIIQI